MNKKERNNATSIFTALWTMNDSKNHPPLFWRRADVKGTKRNDVIYPILWVIHLWVNHLLYRVEFASRVVKHSFIVLVYLFSHLAMNGSSPATVLSVQVIHQIVGHPKPSSVCTPPQKIDEMANLSYTIRLRTSSSVCFHFYWMYLWWLPKKPV